MKLARIPNVALVAVFLTAGGALGLVAARAGLARPQERSFTVVARKYAYDPPVLRVNRGDRVHIRLVSKDVTHGFFLEGYDLDAKSRPDDPAFWVRHPSSQEPYQQVEEISFIAGRPGKFRYRCSTTCGYMHPFMQGELIVSPNYLFPTSLGLSLGLVVGMLFIFTRPPGAPGAPRASGEKRSPAEG